MKKHTKFLLAVGLTIIALSIGDNFIEKLYNNVWGSANRVDSSYLICSNGNLESTLIPMPTDGISRTVATMESLCEISNGEVIYVFVGSTFDRRTLYVTAWTTKWIARKTIQVTKPADAVTEVNVAGGAVNYVLQDGFTPVDGKITFRVVVLVIIIVLGIMTSTEMKMS